MPNAIITSIVARVIDCHDLRNSGASDTSGSSRPPKRTCKAPSFTPARSNTSFRRTINPKRITHRAVRPLGAGNSRLYVNARIAGTLADRSKLHAWQAMKDVLSGQRQRLIYIPLNGQAKLVDIYIARESWPNANLRNADHLA